MILSSILSNFEIQTGEWQADRPDMDGEKERQTEIRRLSSMQKWMVTKETKLKDVLKTPAGHDILAKAFYSLGLSEKILTATPLGSLKINSLKSCRSASWTMDSSMRCLACSTVKQSVRWMITRPLYINGGKKLCFIKSTPAVLRIPMGMGLEISTGSLKSSTISRRWA